LTKTNVMRMLSQAGIVFTPHEYEYDENDLSGIHVSDKLNIPEEQVFKTLVTKGAKGGIYVFCVPVSNELDLKKAAKAAGDKSIAMVHVKELLSLTGYIRGGCSPVGMKKRYPTFIEETAQLYDTIAVSAGQRGVQVELNPEDLAEFIGASFADIAV
jgi:Cys-tRNA(Pro)/Cys-tRNA(Cys) deacylase